MMLVFVAAYCRNCVGADLFVLFVLFVDLGVGVWIGGGDWIVPEWVEGNCSSTTTSRRTG